MIFTRLAAGLGLAAMLLLSACSTRSISASDYDSGYGSRSNYVTELSEFDVLGIDRAATPSDEEIAKQLARAKRVTLTRASRILVIQSGAMQPDAPMVQAIQKRYSMGTFTGVSPSIGWREDRTVNPAVTAKSYARALRVAAAQGGHDKIMVYWGVLESARENLVTSTVSWVPIVGWVLPDERQRMRIRLRVALIDTATGDWEMFSPEPIDDRTFSNMIGRREADQGLVATLKEKAYAGVAAELQQRFER
ncbi:MAG: aminopeptidase [Ideonella sp. MAG2]|nr:MAG: aminopeptidase [Ideonella sp. MAG2]